MKRSLLICLIALFSYYGVAFAATEFEDILNIPKSAFVVENICEYTLYTKKLPGGIFKFRRSFTGNGVFAGIESEPHLALTAGHVLECQKELDDSLFDGSLQKTDIDFFEIRSAAVFAVFDDSKHIVNVLEKGPDGLGPNDIAVIGVVLPKGFPHYHVPILKNKDAYGMKSGVSIYGFMPSIGVWRLKTGKIESINNDVIQIETHVYPGLSGSPVIFWDGQKHYLVGVVIGTYTNELEGYIDVAWATRLTDNVIAELEKKAASFNKK